MLWYQSVCLYMCQCVMSLLELERLYLYMCVKRTYENLCKYVEITKTMTVNSKKEKKKTNVHTTTNIVNWWYFIKIYCEHVHPKTVTRKTDRPNILLVILCEWLTSSLFAYKMQMKILLLKYSVFWGFLHLLFFN